MVFQYFVGNLLEDNLIFAYKIRDFCIFVGNLSGFSLIFFAQGHGAAPQAATANERTNVS